MIADEMMVYLALGKTGRQGKPRDFCSAANFLRDIWMIRSYRSHLIKAHTSCIGMQETKSHVQFANDPRPKAF